MVGACGPRSPGKVAVPTAVFAWFLLLPAPLPQSYICFCYGMGLQPSDLMLLAPPKDQGFTLSAGQPGP